MKRADLERKLRMAGCYLKREGCSHLLVVLEPAGVLPKVTCETLPKREPKGKGLGCHKLRQEKDLKMETGGNVEEPKNAGSLQTGTRLATDRDRRGTALGPGHGQDLGFLRHTV